MTSLMSCFSVSMLSTLKPKWSGPGRLIAMPSNTGIDHGISDSITAPGYHLTDGRVMLSLMPWSIPVFEGMAIKRPGPDHFGFKVESIETLKQDIKDVIGGCSYLAPMPMGGAKESDVRKAMFAASATGKYQLTDPGGVWIGVTDE